MCYIFVFLVTHRVVQIVHTDGEVSEVVPSSNPDSPPVDAELVAELEKRKQNGQEDFFQDFTSSQSLSDDKGTYGEGWVIAIIM